MSATTRQKRRKGVRRRHAAARNDDQGEARATGVHGGTRRRGIDHEKVRALRAQGLKYREIAEQMGISIPSVSRIVNSKERK